MFCPVNQIRQIETGNIVPNDDIWIDFFNKISPGLQQLCFVGERENLRAHNMRACVKCENISNKRLRFACKGFNTFNLLRGKGRTLPGDHVGNLDDGVHLSFGKYTFPTRTFDIET